MEEHEIGVIAIAVPILDMNGNVKAALNCISQTKRVNAEYLSTHILPLLQETANELRMLL